MSAAGHDESAAGHDDLARRRLRRAVLRAHHPDLGGDPAELVRRLAALQDSAADSQNITFIRRPRGWRVVTARLGRMLTLRPRRAR